MSTSDLTITMPFHMKTFQTLTRTEHQILVLTDPVRVTHLHNASYEARDAEALVYDCQELDGSLTVLEFGTAGIGWAEDLRFQFHRTEFKVYVLLDSFEELILDDSIPHYIKIIKLSKPGDLADIPSNFFDIMHIANRVGLIQNWPSVFENAFRVLKPNGILEIEEPCYMNVQAPYAACPNIHKLAAELRNVGIDNLLPFDLSYLDVYSPWDKLIDSAGFLKQENIQYQFSLQSHFRDAFIALYNLLESPQTLGVYYEGLAYECDKQACSVPVDVIVAKKMSDLDIANQIGEMCSGMENMGLRRRV